MGGQGATHSLSAAVLDRKDDARQCAMQEVAAPKIASLVLEDTVELQCIAADHVPLRTKPGVVSMTESSIDLGASADRIVVG